jgi:hypothetical protein
VTPEAGALRVDAQGRGLPAGEVRLSVAGAAAGEVRLQAVSAKMSRMKDSWFKKRILIRLLQDGFRVIMIDIIQLINPDIWGM